MGAVPSQGDEHIGVSVSPRAAGTEAMAGLAASQCTQEEAGHVALMQRHQCLTKPAPARCWEEAFASPSGEQVLLLLVTTQACYWHHNCVTWEFWDSLGHFSSGQCRQGLGLHRASLQEGSAVRRPSRSSALPSPLCCCETPGCTRVQAALSLSTAQTPFLNTKIFPSRASPLPAAWLKDWRIKGGW